jgi:hypothetical protein
MLRFTLPALSEREGSLEGPTFGPEVFLTATQLPKKLFGALTPYFPKGAPIKTSS